MKLNVEGAGNYRVAYDEASWKLLLATLPGMNVPDQVNLLSDAWAFAQEGRKPLSFYTDLVDRLPASTTLAVREQIINAQKTKKPLQLRVENDGVKTLHAVHYDGGLRYPNLVRAPGKADYLQQILATKPVAKGS